jgi:hypothetical protein
LFGTDRFSTESEFVSAYGRKHQAIRVRPTNTFEMQLSDVEASSSSSSNLEGVSYSWMLQAEKSCRTLLTVVVDSKSSKAIARRDVPPFPSWRGFVNEWCWDTAKVKSYSILYLAIDSQWPLNSRENQAERDRFGELVSAILEANE